MSLEMAELTNKNVETTCYYQERMGTGSRITNRSSFLMQ